MIRRPNARPRGLSLRRPRPVDLSGQTLGHLQVSQRCGHDVGPDGKEEWCHEVYCADCDRHFVMWTNELLAKACCSALERHTAGLSYLERVRLTRLKNAREGTRPKKAEP